MAEQQLILVDKNDKFLGKYAPKGKCHTGKGLHHRAFTILIFNKKGKILLQKRKHKIWNGYWDLTNSHLLHKKEAKNETYKEAVKRCLKREWGIELPVKKLFAFNYFTSYGNFCENEYCLILIGKYDKKVYPNPEVIYGYKWMKFEKLLKDIKINPSWYTPWLIQTLRKVAKFKNFL